MSHIIILGADGEEIGREEHDPETGGRIADNVKVHEIEDVPTIIRVNFSLSDILGKAKKEKDEG